MRVRKIIATVGAAVLLAGLTASPASAGTGPSQWCTDPWGYLGLGASTPVTLAVEVAHPPTSTGHQTVWLCYSTSATSTPNSIIGGAVGVDVHTDTGTTYPGAYVAIVCAPDANVSVGPLACHVPNTANVAPFDVAGTPAGGTCLVALNGWCQYYLPGVAVYPDRTPYPLLAITVAGTYVPVNLTPYCVGVLATC